MRRKSGWQMNGFLRGFFFWPVVGLLAAFGVRFAMISNPGRIGHLATEVDAFLKECELGLIPRGRTILLINRKRAANRALLDCYRQHMTVWDNPLAYKVLAEIAKIPAIRLPLGRPILGLGEAAGYAAINWLWGERPPPIRLTPQIESDGQALLARLGVPEGAWFVALHVREEGYAPGDDQHHAHRNADVSTYRAAIRAIVAAGGWVVRVGDPTMTPLAPMERVIDYATSPLKTDWMDIWLCAHCRFFIGTTSGLYLVATMFGKRTALANMVPLGAALGMGPNDISIAKGHVRDGEPIPMAEIFEQGISTQRYAEVFTERGVTLVPNSGDEIRALVQEMLDRLEGVFQTTEDDEELQRRFTALHRPNDYCHGAVSRMGRDWLRENRHLLEG